MPPHHAGGSSHATRTDVAPRRSVPVVRESAVRLLSISPVSTIAGFEAAMMTTHPVVRDPRSGTCLASRGGCNRDGPIRSHERRDGRHRQSVRPVMTLVPRMWPTPLVASVVRGRTDRLGGREVVLRAAATLAMSGVLMVVNLYVIGVLR